MIAHQFSISVGFGLFAVFCLAIGIAPPSVHERAFKLLSHAKDISGHEIGVELPVRSLAVLVPPALSSYVTIDEGFAHVAGVSLFIHRLEGRGLFGQLFPVIKSLPIMNMSGSRPDPEDVLRLRPDAVLAWNGQCDALRKTGYPGIIELGISSGQKEFYIWQLLGEIALKTKRAEALWKASETKRKLLSAFRPRVAGLTILPMAPDGPTWWVGGSSSDLTPLIEGIGASNPAKDRILLEPADPEEILRLDPDFIIMPASGNDVQPSRIYEDPRWQPLKAVRLRRVYLAPYHSTLNAPVDGYLALLWLSEIVYPSLPHMTRAAYQQTYFEAYHRRLSDEEIDAALFLRKNAASAGYERFARTATDRR